MSPGSHCLMMKLLVQDFMILEGDLLELQLLVQRLDMSFQSQAVPISHSFYETDRLFCNAHPFNALLIISTIPL